MNLHLTVTVLVLNFNNSALIKVVYAKVFVTFNDVLSRSDSIQ